MLEMSYPHLSSSSCIAGSSPSSRSASSKGYSTSSCTSELWQGVLEILPVPALNGTPRVASSLFTGSGLAFGGFLEWSFLLLFFFLFLEAFPPPEPIKWINLYMKLLSFFYIEILFEQALWLHVCIFA
jgi:hypothetical protein